MSVQIIKDNSAIIITPSKINESFLLPLLAGKTLTARESDVLQLLLIGYTAKKVARQLGISFRTVEAYIDRLKLKMNCHTKSELLEKVLCQLLF